MPDLTGKVVIVTGGNTGIGKETVKHLLSHNAKVYLASRSRDKAEVAIADLKAEIGKEAIFLALDLASLDGISRSVKEFQSKEKELHVLFNSAGVMYMPLNMLTKDGYDITIGTNVLGHAHFTLQLLGELEAGAQTSNDGKSRVVNVSSSGAYSASAIHYDAYARNADPSMKEKIGKWGIYFESKLGNSIWSNELARRVADKNIISVALNPGNINTDLQRNWNPIARMISRWLLEDVYHGAMTSLYAGTAPEVINATGGWFVPWARTGKPNPVSKDPKVGAELWDWVEAQRKGH